MVSYDKATQDDYQNLCNHIIIQAVHDYVEYSEKLWWINVGGRVCERRDETAGRYAVEMNRIKEFVFSDWFYVLCGIDPRIIWTNTVQKAEKAVQALETRKLKEDAKRGKEKGKQKGNGAN